MKKSLLKVNLDVFLSISRLSIYLSHLCLYVRKGRNNLVEEGKERGYYVKTKKGESYVISSGTIKFYLLDVTNPDARTWMKYILKRNMIYETGASGWMADFGGFLHEYISHITFYLLYLTPCFLKSICLSTLSYTAE